MKLFSVENIPGQEYQTIVLVKGSIVQSKHAGNDITAAIKKIVGSDTKQYSEMLSQAREEATKRMITEAETFGADGIVGVRFCSSNINDGTTEIIAFGTAVKFSNNKKTSL